MSDAGTRRRSRLSGLSVDWHAAREATRMAAIAVVVLYVVQLGVTAAMTSGQQPVGSVDTVPVDPQAQTWADAPETTVKLHKQNIAIPHGGGTVDEVTVKTVTNESHIAVRMEWKDPTDDTSTSSPENYSDAAAVMFGTGEIPPITMGAVGDAVNIWYWRAAWETNQSSYGSGGMYAYPNDRAGGPTKPGLAAGNGISKSRNGGGAQNLYAEGYGSTSYAPVQPVQAEGERTDDGWAVTFTRERVTDGTYDATLNGKKDVYVAFAVWNGSADERNGQKSITLQYKKLDLDSGKLVSTDSSSQSGGNKNSPSAGAGRNESSGSSGGGSAGPTIGGWMAILVASVLLVWLVSYYRMR